MKHQPKQIVMELNSVTKRYGGKKVVRDLSLTLAPGTAIGLLGPNGAGKTTAIKLIMGLIRRDGGSVTVLGSDPAEDDLAVKQRVGYVPEQHFIHRWMRVHEAIRFCRAFYNNWNDTLCDELMTLLKLDPNKKVRALSKGMVVKLSLLLAISHEPELLILDEPMAGLDPIAREDLLDGVLRGMGERKQSLVLSSHTFSDVQRLADTIAIMHEGDLLVHCPVDELITRTKRIRAVMHDGAKPQNVPETTIWQRTNGREWQVTVADFDAAIVERIRSANDLSHVEVTDLNLEEIFKDYIRGREEPS